MCSFQWKRPRAAITLRLSGGAPERYVFPTLSFGLNTLTSMERKTSSLRFRPGFNVFYSWRYSGSNGDSVQPGLFAPECGFSDHDLVCSSIQLYSHYDTHPCILA